ncbi:uncharacterized protein LOC144709265 [Wolffia australiana]
MRMKVHLDASGLWEVISGEEVNQKKDQQALSVILSAIPEDVMDQLDSKKAAKENWEVLRVLNLGVDRVIQSRIQGLGRQFELLTIKKDEAFGDMSLMTMEEVIGSLKVHELQLNEQEQREEEQALLMRAQSKFRREEAKQSSVGRGKGSVRSRRRGRSHGRSSEESSADGEKRIFDKSKKEEKANLVESGGDEVSALLMAVEEEASDILFQSSNGYSSASNVWFLETRATSHVTGTVKFGDGSRITYVGKGPVNARSKDGSVLKLEKVLYAPTLKVNILSLGVLDDLGYPINLRKGTLFIYDTDEKLLARVMKSDGLYKLELEVVESCHLSEESSRNSMLWHRRQLTAPNTPQQNGVVERRNRTVMLSVRVTLKEKNVPMQLWAEDSIRQIIRDVIFEEGKEWDWKTSPWANTNTELVVANLASIEAEQIERDEVSPTADDVEEERSSSSQSQMGESSTSNTRVRMRSLEEIYEANSPVASPVFDENCLMINEEPSNYREAVGDVNWKRAME